LHDSLQGLTYLPVREEFWERLAEYSFELFRKEISAPLTDTYIALVCIENQASILHQDKHFDLIAQKSSLKTFS